jgi:siroheme synthase (precorrin-2 oxidase/ferrochelatase)
METQNHLEANEGWAEAGLGGEQWERLQSLLELVRREHQRTELSPERREQIRERVLARFEKLEARRRRWRLFFAAAGVALGAGIAVTLALRARAA